MVRINAEQMIELTPVANPPTPPTEGKVYYDSNMKRIRFYNGTEWVNL